VSTASNVSGRDGNDIRGSLDLFRLGGRAALVTGAARGLGRAMALALADAGADIVAVDAAPLNDLANEIEKLGSGCVPLAADLSQLDPPAARDLVDRGKDTFPALDILVNNAGTIRRGPVLETTAQDWAAVIGLNLTTPFFLAQAFARVLVQHGRGGSIINMASLNSFQGGVEVLLMRHRSMGCSELPARWPTSCPAKASESMQSRPGTCLRSSPLRIERTQPGTRP
jgi:NAD(P)-dependent dehydrogenase (short-subunit alcohol dehydrogenase family)